MDRSIGQASTALGLSQDTLRYYEKIGLVPKVGKNRSGRRNYSEVDLTRLRFIQRAHAVGFSLTEIGHVLKLRANPSKSSRAVRAMAQKKCAAMQKQMADLQRMQEELGTLLSLCDGKGEHCPILEGLDGAGAAPSCCQ